MTLEEIVGDFIRNCRDKNRAEEQSFRNEPSLTSAIQRAALCLCKNGKRHPHQKRIPKNVLQKAERQLQLIAKKLKVAATFDDIHRLVTQEIRGIQGIGALTVYDIAHRIGAYLDKPPTLVYLHAGTKIGARKLLHVTGQIIDRKNLPAAFSKLTAAEIEDCLCIYKDGLQKNCQTSLRRNAC